MNFFFGKMRNIQEIHSEVFRSPHSTLHGTKYMEYDVNSKRTNTTNAFIPPAAPALCEPSEVVRATPTEEHVFQFDHHCQFAFMRSCLSRRHDNSDMTDLCSLPGGRKSVYDILLTARGMSPDEIGKFLASLKATILSR